MITPAVTTVFERAEREPERVRFMVASGDAWRPVTCGAFADDVRSVAAGLLDRGIVAGDMVAVLGHNSLDWLVAAYAIQAIGAILVPIYPSSTPDQVAYILDHANARALFVDDLTRLPLPSAHPLPHPLALSLTAPPRAPARPLPAPALTDIALMLYTSGTSGPPKAVPLTHTNLQTNARDWIASNASLIDEHMIDLAWLPFSHIFGFGEISIGHTLGWTSYLSTPARVVADLPKVRPSVFMSVPSIWSKLAVALQTRAFAEVTGAQLRLCISGGAGLDKDVKERFREHGLVIIEGYGLTECSPTLTLNRPDCYRFDSVGLPLASVALRLADDGEILARGPSIFGGYFKDEHATAVAFTADGWFKTGDVGRFTDDGFLQIIDRKKDILVTAGGKNVAPANIEVRFADDPAIAHVVVYGDAKKYLVALVWAQPDATHAQIDAAIARVNAQLASFETIKRFDLIETPLTIESGFLTPTLKVKRKRVYETFAARFEALYG